MVQSATSDEPWTVFEKLLLAQAVYKFSDNWLQITKTMRQNPLIERPENFFTQKNCQGKYRLMIEPLEAQAESEIEQRKIRGETVPLNDTQRMPPAARLARDLYAERVKELHSSIKEYESRFSSIVAEIAEIRAGKRDDYLRERLREEEVKYHSVAAASRAAIANATAGMSRTDALSASGNQGQRLTGPATSIRPVTISTSSQAVPPSLTVPARTDAPSTRTRSRRGSSVEATKVEPDTERTPLFSIGADTQPTVVAQTPAPLPTSTMRNTRSRTSSVSKAEPDAGHAALALQPDKPTQTTRPSAPVPTSPKTPLAEPMEVFDQLEEQSTSTQAIPRDVRRQSMAPADEEDIMDLDVKVEEEDSRDQSDNATPRQEPHPEVEPRKTDLYNKVKRFMRPVTSPTADSEFDTPRTIGGGDNMDIDESIAEEVVDEASEISPRAQASDTHPHVSPTAQADAQEHYDSTDSSTPANVAQSDGEVAAVTSPEASDFVGRSSFDSTRMTAVASPSGAERLDVAESAGSPCSSGRSPRVVDTKATAPVSEGIKDDASDDDDVRMVNVVSDDDEAKEQEVADQIKDEQVSETMTPRDVRETPTSGGAPASTPGDVGRTPSDNARTPSYSAAESPEAEQKFKKWQKTIQLMFTDVCNHRNASVFQQPIKVSEAPAYYDVVKEPIDLKTLRKRVRDGLVKDTDQLHRDLMLMFMNAIMFNKEDTDIYQWAQGMKDDVEQQIKRFKQSEGSRQGAYEPTTRRKSMSSR